MNVKEFANSMVKIDYVEQSQSYGHYPFQMYSENEEGQVEVGALALGDDVRACYRKVKDNICKGFNKIFLSLDFPGSEDMKHDFVAIFSIFDNAVDLYAIPYDIKTGERYKEIRKSELLNELKDQFIKFTGLENVEHLEPEEK